MKNFIYTLITIMIFILWFLPAFMMFKCSDNGEWGVLYLPIFIISMLWGTAIYEEY